MPNKNTTLTLHATLAHEIKTAKKTMFKRHREGVPLRAALDQFGIDIAQRFEKVAPPAVMGPIGPMSTIVDVEASPTPETELFDEVQEQSMRAIMTLLDARGIPTCIKRGLADALEETAKIAGVNQRTIWTTNPGPGLNVNSKVLWEVFETPSVQEVWDLPHKPDPMQKLRGVERAPETLPKRSVTVPIIGTVGDGGVKLLFDDVVDEAKLDERDRVQGEVNTILTLFDSPTPDFINDAVVDAIGRACDHFGIDEPEYEIGYQGQTRDALTQLFAKTKMFNLRDIETPLSDLSWAISTIVKSPIAPERLRRSVGDFATDINQLDESPEGIERALGFGVCGYGSCRGSGDPLNPCPGPESPIHTRKDEENEEDDGGVTVALPNGKEVTLYGDAADMAKEKPEPEASPALAAAISEIINNPATPTDLYNSVADFVTDLRSGRLDNSTAAIQTLLTQIARKEASHAQN